MDKDVQIRPTARTSSIHRGLTLPELLVTLSIIAIGTTLATPSMQALLLENQLVVAVNQFILSLSLARSEAITRNRRVTLCPLDTAQQCGDASQWADGWMLFLDDNANKERDSNEAILRIQPAIDGSLSIHSSRHRSRITYQPIGSAGGSNGTFTFCDARQARPARAVILSVTGRPRVSTTKPDGLCKVA